MSSDNSTSRGKQGILCVCLGNIKWAYTVVHCGSLVMFTAVPLEEVLCARYQPIKRHCCMLPARQRQQHHFIIHALKRHKHKPWLWSIQKVKLSGPDIDKVKSWVNYINDSIRALTDRWVYLLKRSCTAPVLYCTAPVLLLLPLSRSGVIAVS